MLRKLLFICVSLLPLALLSQQALPGGSSPSETVVGDPGKTINDLSHFISEISKVSLTWKVNDSLPDFFAIERSENGKDYELVTILNNLGKGPSYQWTDDSPKKG